MFFIERSNSETLTTYSVVNFLSHAVSYAFLIYNLPSRVHGWEYLHLIVLFYVCAFCAAPLYGIVADLTENPHKMAQCGVMLQLCAIFLPYEWKGEIVTVALTAPIKAVFLGLGFGFFQSFAQTTVLRRDSDRFADIAIFLAPASLGVAAILVMPKLGYFLLPLLPLVACMPDRCKQYGLSLKRRKSCGRQLYIVLPFLAAIMVATALETIAIPSLDTLNRWNKSEVLLLALALSFGTFIGGYLADKIGAAIIAITLPIGALMLAKTGIVFLIGAALCASSLPLLIKLASLLLPRAPGFAAGLCSCLTFPAAWLAVRTQNLPVKTLGIVGAALAFVLIVSACFLLPQSRTGLLKKLAEHTDDEEEEEDE